MENILQKIILSLSAVIASFGALFSQIPPEAITPIDPMPEIFIESPKANEPIPENNAPQPSLVNNTNPVPATPTPRPDPIQTAYEIGKAQGYAQGVVETLEQTKPKEELPIDEEEDMPKKTTTTKVEEVAPTGAKVSLADIQVESLMKSKSLNSMYVVNVPVEIGVLLYDDNGEFNRNAGVTMTTPDESQNKTNGFANTKNGNDGRWFYDFVYIPAESGDHELTFTGAGLSKTITIKVL